MKSKTYEFLFPEFLEAMNDIGRYGFEKYGSSAINFGNPDLTVNRAERTQTQEIHHHICGHYEEYMDGIPHDHFGTLKHQLAAAAFNVMIEMYFLIKEENMLLSEGEVV